MRKSQGSRAIAVVISSTMPSAKYSCSGSPDKFWNGKTAIDGLSGSGITPTLPSPRKRGRVREGAFQSHPVYAYRPCDILEALLAHVLERKIEAARGVLLYTRGDADPARQARSDVDAVAKGTAVSMMMSPTLTPMRNSIRRPAGKAALRSTISPCTSMAQRTRSTDDRRYRAASRGIAGAMPPLSCAAARSFRFGRT